MAKKVKFVKNLLGELVISDESLAALKRKSVQFDLFDNTLSEEEKRARRLAQQHREEGGKELFGEKAEQIFHKPLSGAIAEASANLNTPSDGDRIRLPRGLYKARERFS